MKSFHFVGKKNYHVLHNMENEKIHDFLLSIKKYFEGQKQILKYQLMIPSSEFSYDFQEFPGYVGFKVDLSYDLYYHFYLPPNTRPETHFLPIENLKRSAIIEFFAGMSEYLKEKANVLREDKNLHNLEWVIEYISAEDASFLTVEFEGFIPLGYHICPICEENKSEYDGSEKIYDIPTNRITFLKNDILICPENKFHGSVYFMDHPFNEVKRINFKKIADISPEYHVHRVDPFDDNQVKVPYILNKYSKLEEPSFRMINYKHNSSVLILFNNNQPIGYTYWNEITEWDGRVLRQIFIDKAYRNQGIGTRFLEECIKYESAGSMFFVESPNRITYKLLLKLGHISENDKGECEFHNCTFVA